MLTLRSSSAAVASAVRPLIGTSQAACAGTSVHPLYLRRTLATSAARSSPWAGPITRPTNRYLVIAEDYPNPGALARRLEAREQHMQDVRAGVEAGRVELAGGLLSKDFNDVDEYTSPVYSLCGSVLVVHGESLEEVRQRVLDDEYARASAWDPSALKIFPLLPAFLKPAETPSMNEQNEAIARRTPYGVSPRRAKTIARNEVFVNDPRTSGAALNQQDRRSLNQSLSALRRGHTGPPKQADQQPTTTLGSLRQNFSPPRYNEAA